LKDIDPKESVIMGAEAKLKEAQAKLALLYFSEKFHTPSY
jgi:hypothetical protein